MANIESKKRARNLVIGTAVIAGLITAVAFAQDYRAFRGNTSRSGRATAQTGIAVAETTWNNFGRGFLRWWDPASIADVEIDNGPNPSTTSTGVWTDPDPIGSTSAILASNFTVIDTVVPVYLYTTSVAGTSTTDPRAGATATYTWTITGLDPNLRYEVDFSLPSGATNTLPLGGTNLLAQNRFNVVEVVDVAGSNVSILDSQVSSGYVPLLGTNNNATYAPTAGGTITVTAYNTCPLNSTGGFMDSGAQPGQELVYADAIDAKTSATKAGAGIVASPVVGLMANNSPVTAAPDVFPQRVVSARNDSVFIGATNSTFNIGNVTSFTHNGVPAAAIADPQRANRVWSWPAKRPLNNNSVDATRYATDVQTWLAGPNTTDVRSIIKRQVDDLNAECTTSGVGFTSHNEAGAAPFLGPDYLGAVVQPAATSTVNWSAANFPAGTYNIDVYIPAGTTGPTFTKQATYTILQGAAVLATRTLDQTANTGWVRLAGGVANTNLAPINVTVQDTGAVADPAGTLVAADAVRFTTQADWSDNSTPVFVSTNITPSVGPAAPQDVVVVASETGRLTCMDAHGDPTTGLPPQVYWTYPTEVSATDPNASLAEDGGVNEVPVNFNMTSAVVGTVGGKDYLYVGSSNGRVYCFDMAGRGDGSTRRVWTYPDDYRPDAPTTPAVPSNLGAISGSVTFGVAFGQPAIFVPTSSGKILALSAAGTPASKTTSVIWSYPGGVPFGPIVQTPLYDAPTGSLYFAAPDPANPGHGELISLFADTGAVKWQVTTHLVVGVPTAFGDFSSASPTLITNTETGIGSCVYFIDSDGRFYCLDPATGAIRFENNDLKVGADASLNFAYMRTYNAASTIVDPVPAILVATKDGQYVGFFADGSANVGGLHFAWDSYSASSGGQKASFAVGGYPNTIAANRAHAYIGDSQGNFFAFSSEDDANGVPPYSSGTPPINIQIGTNNPLSAAFAEFTVGTHYQLYAPADWQSLFEKARNGTLAAADVAAGTEVTRTNIEYGEELDFIIRGVPDPVTVGTNYTMSLILQNNTSRVRPRQIFSFPYMDAGVQKRVIFFNAIRPKTSDGTLPGTQDYKFQVRVGAGLNGAVGASYDFNSVIVNNPFAIQFPTPGIFGFATPSQAGMTTTLNDPTIQGNNPIGVDAGFAPGPTDNFLKSTYGAVESDEAGGYLGATGIAPGSGITHGGIGQNTMYVVDRSLQSMGGSAQRAALSVRMSSSELTWQPITNPGSWLPDIGHPMPVKADPVNDLGVYKPLNRGQNKAAWNYEFFEDYPFQRPNVSKDYPDISRSNVTANATTFGQSSTLTLQALGLLPPVYGAGSPMAALVAYRQKANYVNPVPRTFANTPVTVAGIIPTYQPASQVNNAGNYTTDYRSRQEISAINGSQQPIPGVQRSFALATRIAPDENLITQTKTLDLGAIPGGGGFGDNVNGAVSPWNAGSLFRPSNTPLSQGTNAQYGAMSVLNNGNANMLNVRIAKGFDKSVGLSLIHKSLDIFSPTGQDLDWFDGQYNLFTDLDPQLSVTARAGYANGMVPAQKPRVGDLAPNRMSRNPIARSNVNLNTGGGPLVPATLGNETGDVRLGMAVPLGTPVGVYQRNIYAFEDTDILSGVGPPVATEPSLGPNWFVPAFGTEPYTQNPTLLKFTVGETQLTDTFQPKTGPSLDNLLFGQQYAWSSRQPTSLRDDNGNVWVAFTSDRRNTIGSTPTWTPPNKTVGDFSAPDSSRIFVALTAGAQPTGAVPPDSGDHSPISDLNNTSPSAPGLGAPASRWFNTGQMIPDPSLTRIQLQSYFGLVAGEALIAGTNNEGVLFSSPVFSTSGLADPTTDTSVAGRAAATNPYMAFLGESTRFSTNSGTAPVRRVFLTKITGAPITLANTSIVPGDEGSVKSKPSLVSRNTEAIVTYTTTANGTSDILTAYTPDGVAWSSLKRLGFRDEFSDVGAPSTSWRPAVDPLTGAALPNGRMDVMFTAKVRGRRSSDAYLTRVDPSSISAAGDTVGLIPFEQRTDDLVLDAANNTFWAPGLQWMIDDASIANFNIYMAPTSGSAYVALIPPASLAPGAPAANKAFIDRDNGRITADVPAIGGKVYIDTRAGSVKFSGAVIPGKAKLAISYHPKVVRLGSSPDANYHGVSQVFDQRFIGIHDPGTPNRADEALLTDLNFTFNELGVPAATNAPVRYDRVYTAYGRTGTNGTDRTRPYYATLRYGVRLPYPVFVQPNGSINLTVTGPGGATFYYQVDPVQGQIYFPVEMEGRAVTVTYTASTAGSALPGIVVPATTVSLITETPEVAVPILQSANESDLSLSLDPQSAVFNPINPAIRRPPLVWMFWTSTRGGGPDIFYQTIAPNLGVRPTGS